MRRLFVKNSLKFLGFSQFCLGVMLLGTSISILSGPVAFADPLDPADLLHHLQSMNEEEAFSYRQRTYEPVDPIGDRALILRTTRAMDSIARALVGQGTSVHLAEQWDESGDPAATALQEQRKQDQVQTEIQQILSSSLSDFAKAEQIASLQNTLMQVQGRRNPFRIQGFKDMLAEILLQESKNGLTPTLGTPQDWSPEIRAADPDNVELKFPKLLNCLALGVCEKFMATGHEQELRALILQGPNDAVTFSQVFRWSYELNRGDVYLTLMTIENLLSANWKAPDREHIPFIEKLEDLQSSWNHGGTRFGTWYHFVGTLLFGFVSDKNASKSVGFVESIGAKILHLTADKSQEYWANQKGGTIGEDLHQMIVTGSYNSRVSNPLALRTESYLDHSEDYRDRLHVPSDPDLVITHAIGDRDQLEFLLSHKSEDLGKCTLKIFDQAAPQTAALATQLLLGVPVNPAGPVRVVVPLRNTVSRIRVVLSQCTKSPNERGFDIAL
jgi:hypothetical protein